MILAWVMIFWKALFACEVLIQYAQNLQIPILKTHKRYVHLNSKHARDLNLAFRKFGGMMILKMFIFGHFIAKNPIWVPLITKFLECHAWKVHSNFPNFKSLAAHVCCSTKCTFWEF